MAKREHSGAMLESRSDRVFNFFNMILMIIILAIIIYPLWFIIIASISDSAQVTNGNVLLWPKGFHLDAYRKVGVNRLSLVVQSLDDGLLQSIGRIHTNEQARQAVAKGYYLSFGERTFASRKTLEALREVPSDRLFFETDDSPAAIETIYARAAEVRRTTVEELRRATAENYRRLFGGGK